MTVGEKIQHHRKAKKLSQEELAGQLFVSRQTISQWEKDQTLPSIDNLIRLKEIFGISLDELLTDTPAPAEQSARLLEAETPPSEETPSPAEEPCERHVFRATPEEIRAYHKDTTRINRRAPLPIIALVLGAIVLCFIDPDMAGMVTFYTGILFVLIVLLIFRHKQLNKTLLENKQRLSQREYCYRIYKDRMEVEIHSQNGDDAAYVIPYRQISSVIYHKTFYLPVHNDRTLLLRKADLAPDSVLHKVLPPKVNPKTIPLSHRLRKNVMLLPLLLCLLGFLGAIAVSSYFDLLFTQSWVWYCFLPFPIASILLGIRLRKKHRDASAAIITGIVTAVVMLLVGSICFISFDIEYDLTSVEERVGVELPQPDQTHVITKRSRTLPGGEAEITYAVVDVTFSQEDAAALQASIAGDDRWIDILPTAFFDLFTQQCNVSTAEYFLIYNEDLQRYNTLPTEPGIYRYLLLLYDADTGVLQVAEYSVEHGASRKISPKLS